MMTFYEYAAWRRKTTLPDAATLLTKAGISPDGPHEVEVMRLTKAMKRAERAQPAVAKATARVTQSPGVEHQTAIRDLDPRSGKA